MGGFSTTKGKAMKPKEGTALELLTEDVSLSCVRLEEILLAPSEEDAVAAELEDVSSTLGRISTKLAGLAASMQLDMAGGEECAVSLRAPQDWIEEGRELNAAPRLWRALDRRLQSHRGQCCAGERHDLEGSL
jgi:hypothetical protein